MKVHNVHQRSFPPGSHVGWLIDSLASTDDALWPRQAWPPIRLDRPLGEGASGGHGPVRYTVERYTPAQSVRFRFSAPKGFHGWHALEILQGEGSSVVLRHTLDMQANGPARLTWPLVFRPLHDALLEDALARAEAQLGLAPRVTPWSPWVRLLRWLMSKGKAASQTVPEKV